MSLKTGVRSGLDLAKEAVLKQLNTAAPTDQFVLLSNDKAYSYEPQPAEKLKAILSNIELSAVKKDASQIFATVQTLLQSEHAPAVDLFYYSNFPKAQFSTGLSETLRRNISLHAIVIQTPQRHNIFIDTAYLNTPVLQAGQANALIVHSRRVGAPQPQNGMAPIVQLSVAGQVKSAASLHFNEQGLSRDTLAFSMNDAGWQRMELSLSDASMPFDDTFRIAARSAPGLSVLVLNEGNPSPYFQAAFRSYNGFQVQEFDLNHAPKVWKDFNLVILNGITTLPASVGQQLKEALESGQNVAFFPGKTRQLAGLNDALQYAGDIRVTALDSISTQLSRMQPGAVLIRDIFESIPDNVQLPTVVWHYQIQSGLTAGGQAALSFRNGDPFFIRYASGRGNFYLCATTADLSGGNFPTSYFFVPFLYQMAAQSQGANVYALTAGKQQAAFVPLNHGGERNMVHLLAPGLDAIPPQSVVGGGVEVFVDVVQQHPGFYTLRAATGDSVVLALNGTRAYSDLSLWDMKALQKEWPDKTAIWQTAETATGKGTGGNGAGLPLWKVCAILALFLAFAESYLLLAKRNSSINTATT